MPEQNISLHKVLLAEGDEAVRYVLHSFLELAGYRIVEAVDALEAVMLAQSELPDVILLDLSLTRLDVLEAIKLIRMSPGLQHVPVLTSSNDGLRAIKFYLHVDELGAGYSDYLTKPFDLGELQEILQKLLAKTSATITSPPTAKATA
jgi:CheY-like chemotaxis protein